MGEAGGRVRREWKGGEEGVEGRGKVCLLIAIQRQETVPLPIVLGL